MSYEPDRARILEELQQFVDCVPDLAADEFTARDFEEAMGLNRSKAGRELERLVRERVLASAERIDPRTGRRCIGYRRIEEGQCD